jgi:hypothetical protein
LRRRFLEIQDFRAEFVQPAAMPDVWIMPAVCVLVAQQTGAGSVAKSCNQVMQTKSRKSQEVMEYT